MSAPILGGPLWTMVATALGRIDGHSAIEAATLANLIRNEGDYASSDPHCVLAAAVERGREADPGEIDALALALDDLGVSS